MHFTYDVALSSNMLMQGDVIRRTPEVENVLKKYHPYYFEKTENRFFIIVTQTCDLVRRSGGDCASRYISLAAVRTLEWVLANELPRYFRNELEEKFGFLHQTQQNRFREFIGRLLNNNEPRFFYLHREPLIQWNQDLCAVLQLNIPLRSSDHYDTLLNAKIVQLIEPFQHKLGYLVGNAYGRIGTKDWTDFFGTNTYNTQVSEAFDMVKNMVEWLDNTEYKGLKKNLESLSSADQTEEAYEEALVKVKKTKERRIGDIVEIMEKAMSEAGIKPDAIQDASQIARIDPRLPAVLK
jgi:hypothetical protein